MLRGLEVVVLAALACSAVASPMWTELLEENSGGEPSKPLCFTRGYSQLTVTLSNPRDLEGVVGKEMLTAQLTHQFHQLVQNQKETNEQNTLAHAHPSKVTIIEQKAEGLKVNVSIPGDYGGLQARAIVDYVRNRQQSEHGNFFPLRIVRIVCTDWLRVPEETAPPTYAPTYNPTDSPTTHKEAFKIQGVVNGFKPESDSNTGPFVHHTCVRLRGGTLIDFPAVGYGNRVRTKLGWTGVPTTRTQCLAACKDMTQCSGVEYYPFYRECWVYGGDPAFISHPVQSTEDKCWTGYLKEEWKIPYRAAFTGEEERPERFVPVPRTDGSRPVVANNAAIVPVPVPATGVPTFTPSMAPKVQTQVIQVHLVDKTQQQPAIPVQPQPQPVGITTIQVPPHGAQPNTVNVPLQVQPAAFGSIGT